ncbi:MAG: LPS export ABC transporter periplasmic protein LptC [Novosphingobium sp.]|nr:LPS export ABC transporter periplasmic protein LptC [Novosphingobium sp.]
MTVEADIIRDRRRAFAAPGGAHDRLIAFLVKALPAAIGVVAAIMILVPLSPRGEISFLLDRNKVAITSQRVAVDKAMYRGQDNNGRPFRLTAGKAVQASSSVPVVEMDDLVATMDMSDGPASLRANHGVYNFHTEQVDVEGPVNFLAADGYSMVTNNVDIDLKTRIATGSGGVSGAVPAGTFSAERIVADLEARTLALEGNARMRMIPGQLRIPR